MLDKKALEDFEEYMNSGALDLDFKNAGEYQRGEMLELLEKLMDVADVADVAATRLIFKGAPPADAKPDDSGQ